MVVQSLYLLVVCNYASAGVQLGMAILCGSDAKLSFYERVLLGQIIENLDSVLSLLETVIIAFV